MGYEEKSTGERESISIVYTCPVCKKGIKRHVYEGYSCCPYCGTPFKKGERPGPEILHYATDEEYRKTREDIEILREKWEKSGRYINIEILETIKPKGFAIYGLKKVRPYRI